MRVSNQPGWLRTREALEGRLDPCFHSFASHYLQSERLTKIWHRAGKRYQRQVRIHERIERQASRARQLRRDYGGRAWKA